jgi:hypothetical protein
MLVTCFKHDMMLLQTSKHRSKEAIVVSSAISMCQMQHMDPHKNRSPHMHVNMIGSAALLSGSLIAKA